MCRYAEVSMGLLMEKRLSQCVSQNRSCSASGFGKLARGAVQQVTGQFAPSSASEQGINSSMSADACLKDSVP